MRWSWRDAVPLQDPCATHRRQRPPFQATNSCTSLCRRLIRQLHGTTHPTCQAALQGRAASIMQLSLCLVSNYQSNSTTMSTVCSLTEKSVLLDPARPWVVPPSLWSPRLHVPFCVVLFLSALCLRLFFTAFHPSSLICYSSFLSYSLLNCFRSCREPASSRRN